MKIANSTSFGLWLLALIGLSCLVVALVVILREHRLTKQARSRFALTLARFRAFEWIGSIGKDRQKRLTYHARKLEDD